MLWAFCSHMAVMRIGFIRYFTFLASFILLLQFCVILQTSHLCVYLPQTELISFIAHCCITYIMRIMRNLWSYLKYNNDVLGVNQYLLWKRLLWIQFSLELSFYYASLCLCLTCKYCAQVCGNPWASGSLRAPLAAAAASIQSVKKLGSSRPRCSIKARLTTRLQQYGLLICLKIKGQRKALKLMCVVNRSKLSCRLKSAADSVWLDCNSLSHHGPACQINKRHWKKKLKLGVASECEYECWIQSSSSSRFASEFIISPLARQASQ